MMCWGVIAKHMQEQGELMLYRRDPFIARQDQGYSNITDDDFKKIYLYKSHGIPSVLLTACALFKAE